jgi:hypothetical protein
VDIEHEPGSEQIPDKEFSVCGWGKWRGLETRVEEERDGCDESYLGKGVGWIPSTSSCVGRFSKLWTQTKSVWQIESVDVENEPRSDKIPDTDDCQKHDLQKSFSGNLWYLKIVRKEMCGVFLNFPFVPENWTERNVWSFSGVMLIDTIYLEKWYSFSPIFTRVNSLLPSLTDRTVPPQVTS